MRWIGDRESENIEDRRGGGGMPIAVGGIGGLGAIIVLVVGLFVGIDPSTLLALLSGDWDMADRSERRHRVECSGLVAAYLQWHLEHSIRSLRHVERV